MLSVLFLIVTISKDYFNYKKQGIDTKLVKDILKYRDILFECISHLNFFRLLLSRVEFKRTSARTDFVGIKGIQIRIPINMIKKINNQESSLANIKIQICAIDHICFVPSSINQNVIAYSIIFNEVHVRQPHNSNI